MVNEKENEPRCGSCLETCGNVWQGYVYCMWLHCDVWADSLQCEHGKFLQDCF